MIFKIFIALAILGGFLMWDGSRNWRLTRVAQSEPSLITCAELAASGPGDNHHIVLGDFLLLSEYVYEQKEGKADWEHAWVPAIALGGELHASVLEAIAQDMPLPAMDFSVMVKLDAANEQQIDAFAARPTLQGLVINEISSLDGETTRLLRQAYPGVDIDDCWIIDVGRGAPSSTGASLQFAGGGVCILGALGIAAAGTGIIKRSRPTGTETDPMASDGTPQA